MSPGRSNSVRHWAHEAARHARIEQLSNSRWSGEVPGCAGVIATGDTRDAVERELVSVLEEWACLGLQLGDEIPVFGSTDLNSKEVGQPASRHA